MSKFIKTVLIDISSSSTTSSIVDLGWDNKRIAFQFPAMTGTALTFLASGSVDGTYAALKNSTAAVSLTIASSSVVAPTGEMREALAAVRYLKLVSGSNEAADRVVEIILSPRDR